MTAPEYDSVPDSFDPDIDDDPYFDSHADIDYAYGLDEYAGVDEMNRRVVEGGHWWTCGMVYPSSHFVTRLRNKKRLFDSGNRPALQRRLLGPSTPDGLALIQV